MPLPVTKKVPSKAIKSVTAGDLNVAKDGDTVKLWTVLGGKVYELSMVPQTSAPASGGSGGTTDHGALSGLTDDDHTQYLLRSVLTTKGDIFVRESSAIGRLAVGSDGQLIIPDTPSTVGAKWGNLVFSNDEIIVNDDEIVTV